MNQTEALLAILNNITISRELMFDVTEIPHCLDTLEQTSFSQDMKKIKDAHQYMKGNIPEKMHQMIKKSLQKYLYILLECHKELLLVEKEEIQDHATLQVYLYIKSYFSNKGSKSYQHIDDSPILRDNYSYDSLNDY